MDGATRTAPGDDLVMRLVEEALKLPESEQEEFIRKQCPGDTYLLQEVKRRVRAELQMGSFLAKPLFPRPTLEHLFQPGQVLLDRFEIVHEIGQGAMGVVYKAIDRVLEKEIAIKCAQPGYQRHLFPEMSSAGEIAHRNICKFFDIHTVTTSYGEVNFLTMEYLEGETLADYLKRCGSFAPGDACDIMRQVCDATEEAHFKGVIHGDLKSGNIILTKGEHGSLVPVITDFGLACRTIGRPLSSQLVAAHGGTPAYMAPELWKGAKGSVASDLFALGVIFYELLTGHLPPKRTAEPLRPGRPEPPFTYELKVVAKDLDRFSRSIRRIVVSCLSENPLERPRSSKSLARSIAIAQRIQRLTFGAAAAAVLLLAGPLIQHHPPNSPNIALLPFEATSQQAVVANLTFHQTIDLLSRATHHSQMFSVVPMSESTGQRTKDLAKSCRDFQATHALLVRFQQQGQQISLRAMVESPCSQELLKDLPLQYDAAEVAYIPGALAGFLTGTLHLPPLPGAVRDNAAGNPDYLAGLRHLRFDSEVDGSIQSLQRAVAVEKDSPSIWGDLARAYRLKFKITGETAYRDLAQQAFVKAESLNPDNARVLQIAGLLHLDAGQYARAAEDFTRVIEIDPKKPDGYLGLARVYQQSDRTQDALQTASKAIELDRSDVESYQLLGGFYYDLGKYDKSAEQFSQIVKLTPQSPDAHLHLAVPLIKLGRYPAAERELQASLKLGETPDAHVNLGAALDYEHRYTEAITHYQRAVEIVPKDYLSWINLADDQRRIAQSRQAKQSYNRALDLLPDELSRNPKESFVRAMLGYVLARLSLNREAKNEIEQALEMSPADAQVIRTVALAYEAIGERQKTLSLLRDAPRSVVDDLTRQPDLTDLFQDPRFITLRAKQQ